MSHTRKKTHTAIYHIFCFVFSSQVKSSHVIVFKSSSVGGIREWAISAAHVAILVVVVAARVTHQRESLGETRIAREVSTIIKSGITRHTHAVFVLITFCHALFLRKLESGYMGLRSLHSRYTRAGGSGSSSPVVGSRGSSRHCSFGCL
jgi:hypothetical protein